MIDDREHHRPIEHGAGQTDAEAERPNLKLDFAEVSGHASLPGAVDGQRQDRAQIACRHPRRELIDRRCWVLGRPALNGTAVGLLEAVAAVVQTDVVRLVDHAEDRALNLAVVEFLAGESAGFVVVQRNVQRGAGCSRDLGAGVEADDPGCRRRAPRRLPTTARQVRPESSRSPWRRRRRTRGIAAAWSAALLCALNATLIPSCPAAAVLTSEARPQKRSSDSSSIT